MAKDEVAYQVYLDRLKKERNLGQLIRNDNLVELKNRIENGLNIDSQATTHYDVRMGTLLWIALELGKVEIADYLDELFLCINAGNSSFTEACQSENSTWLSSNPARFSDGI